MKQVKREDLEVGKKYWIEAKFLIDDGGVNFPLYFDFEGIHLWFDADINIALLEEGKAEEAPKYVKNVIKKLKELDEHNRMVWLNRIMDEFGAEIRTKSYCEGFEQGKFEGVLERKKVKIPKSVADWIEDIKSYYNLYGAMGQIREKEAPSEILKWFDTNPTLTGEVLANAWLDGFEIEVEPMYWVRGKDTNSLLIKRLDGVIAENGGWSVGGQIKNKDSFTFTEKEIKDYDERYWAFAVPVEEEN